MKWRLLRIEGGWIIEKRYFIFHKDSRVCHLIKENGLFCSEWRLIMPPSMVMPLNVPLGSTV